MILYIIAWLVIGFVVAILNNHVFSLIQNKDENVMENASMPIAMAIWALLWPLGLFTLVRMTYILIKQKF